MVTTESNTVKIAPPKRRMQGHVFSLRKGAGHLLDTGADRVSVNPAAAERPELIGEVAERFGVQRCAVAIDAARLNQGELPMQREMVTKSGAIRPCIDVPGWSEQCASPGAGEILLTSWDRDGTGLGYDLGLIRGLTDAGLAASIFHDGVTTITRVKVGLGAAGVSVRRGEMQ